MEKAPQSRQSCNLKWLTESPQQHIMNFSHRPRDTSFIHRKKNTKSPFLPFKNLSEKEMRKNYNNKFQVIRSSPYQILICIIAEKMGPGFVAMALIFIFHNNKLHRGRNVNIIIGIILMLYLVCRFVFCFGSLFCLGQSVFSILFDAHQPETRPGPAPIDRMCVI